MRCLLGFALRARSMAWLLPPLLSRLRPSHPSATEAHMSALPDGRSEGSQSYVIAGGCFACSTSSTKRRILQVRSATPRCLG